MFEKLFRRPPLDNNYHERTTKLENDLAEVRGELNNILQTVESGSREVNKRLARLEIIAGVQTLRDKNDGTD